MSKKSLIILLIILFILISAAILIFKKSTVNAPADGNENVQTMKGDSVEAVNQDLDKIDIGNLDEDFKEIDQDINSL